MMVVVAASAAVGGHHAAGRQPSDPRSTPPSSARCNIEKPVANLHHRGGYANALQRRAAVVVAGAGEGAAVYFEEARVEEDGFEVVAAVEGSVLDFGDGTVDGDVGDVLGAPACNEGKPLWSLNT